MRHSRAKTESGLKYVKCRVPPAVGRARGGQAVSITTSDEVRCTWLMTVDPRRPRQRPGWAPCYPPPGGATTHKSSRRRRLPRTPDVFRNWITTPAAEDRPSSPASATYVTTTTTNTSDCRFTADDHTTFRSRLLHQLQGWNSVAVGGSWDPTRLAWAPTPPATSLLRSR